MRKTKEQIEQINQIIAIIENVLTALTILRDNDVSEAQILRDLNLDQMTFRRICYNTSWVDQAHNKEEGYLKLRESIKEAIPTRKWTEDLFCAVVGLPRTASSCGKIPPDVDKTMIEAIDSLAPIEQTIIRGLFQDKKDQVELGKELGISKSRVQQIKEKALRKMRHPSRLAYIVYGDNYYINKKKAAEEAIQKYAIQSAAEELERLNALIDIKRSILTGLSATPSAKEYIKEQSIEALGLSTRAFNCLTRCGIETIDELCTVCFDDISKIRNMGRKSADEIVEKLKSIGLSLREGEETDPNERFFHFIRH